VVKKTKQRLLYEKLSRPGCLHIYLVNIISLYRAYLPMGLWFGMLGKTAEDCVVRTEQRIICTELLNLDTVYASQLHKASCIFMVPTHPGCRMFVPLPSGKRYRAIKSRTNRVKHRFFDKAVAAIRPFLQ